MPHRIRIILSILSMSSLIVACSTGGPKRGPDQGDRQSQMADLDGAYFAQPVALLFVGYDTDADGIVTREEVATGAKLEWTNMDSAGDGAVSPIDLSKWAESYLGSATARPGRLAFDQNANGMIESIEVERHLLNEFIALDTNKDGLLVRSELVRKLSIPSRQRNSGGKQRRPQGDRPSRR